MLTTSIPSPNLGISLMFTLHIDSTNALPGDPIWYKDLFRQQNLPGKNVDCVFERPMVLVGILDLS